MNAELITIGTELLLGVTVDTNSAYLMQQLATVGVPVRRVTLVRDDMDEIVQTIKAAMTRAELVICAGGLGPTDDDLTREAIARATERPLEFHQVLLDDIAARFAMFKRTMSPSNERQAYVPQGAYIMRNPHGTAPAFVADCEGHYVAALPGVPQELHYLTEHALLPYLQQEHGLTDVLLVREVRLVGLTEAAAGERISDIMLGDNPVVGITAKRGQHTIRVAAHGSGREAALALIEPLVQTIRERFVGHLLDDETLEQRVGRLLNERGLRVALLETDIEAPIFRALSQTEAGRHALLDVRLQPTRTLGGDEEAEVRALAEDLARGERLGLAAVAGYALDEGDNDYRTVYVALAGGAGPPAVFSRGIDYGLAQASDFVATMALEALRRRLEGSNVPATTST
jgi:competence/damage-inducible protein CinA-like protein